MCIRDSPTTFPAALCTVAGFGLVAISAAVMLLPEFVNAVQSRPLTATANDAAAAASEWFTILAVGLITGTASRSITPNSASAVPSRSSR